MAKPLKPIEIRPAQGGKLMCSLSAESPGLANYKVKRDVRRFYDREIRAEGHAMLFLNPTLPVGLQGTPGSGGRPQGPITVVAEARRGDGKRAIVVGNQTTLWACAATEEPEYADDYFAADYTDTSLAGWTQIASGLSSNGRRWEAVQVGDYLCLNNAVDLPLTYRPGDAAALPIYELREQGIASVGTIAAHNGNLLVMDLWQINSDAFLNLMNATESVLPASQDATGLLSVPAATLFPGVTLQVGQTLFWDNGATAKIIALTGGNIVASVPGILAPTGTVVYAENQTAYTAFTDQSQMQRFPWRILPSMEGMPRRFGATVPVAASLGETQLSFQYPIRSLPELVRYSLAGQYLGTSTLTGGLVDIQVTYAGPRSGTLNTSVIGVVGDITMSCLIADPVGNAVTFDNGLMEPSDAATGYAGTYVDLVDDGSAIIKALAMRDYIVIYKESPVTFFGTFTGDITNPYSFQRVPIANQGATLYYRNVIIASGGGYYGSAHIYAGRNAFYKFDIFTQTPQEIPELQPAQAIFFEHAANNPDGAFAAENPLTREWVFGWSAAPTGQLCASQAEDTALCFDYAFHTCRTTSADISAACDIENPLADGDWMFLFGDSTGSIQRYGLAGGQPVMLDATITVADGIATASQPCFTTAHIGMSLIFNSGVVVSITNFISPTQVTILGSVPVGLAANSGPAQAVPAIWHRNGQPYDSVIETGLGDLGMADSEKLVTRYVPVCASKNAWQSPLPIPNAPVKVDFKYALNPAGEPPGAIVAISAIATQPHNLLEPTFIGYYVGVNLTVSGLNNPFALANQIWQAQSIGSQSAGRL
jgi:hypothetical protein